MWGRVQITEQASKSPHNVISRKLPLKIASPTGKVRIVSEFVTIKGHMKLFHAVTNVKIPSVVVECGFLSNEEETKLLSTDEYQNKIAWKGN